MNILATYTPDIEIYSIDEAFLKFDGYEQYDLHTYGVDMIHQVKTNVGIPTSVGIAPTKALSKVANKIAKKFQNRTQGVYVIDSDEKRIKALKWTKINDVWGVGRKLSNRLKLININNAYEFTQLPDAYIRKTFSIVELRLKHELEGKPRLSLDDIKNKKAIATTRSFESDITTLNELKERVATFAVTCAEKLRKQDSHCNVLMLFIHTNGYRTNQKQYHKNIKIKLPYPTSSSITIAKYTMKGLELIYKKGYRYKKAGVITMGLTPKNTHQTNLFDHEDPRHEKLMKTIDSINQKVGNKKLKLGSQDLKRTWKMKQEKLSQRYTTSWDELLEVN